MQILNNKQKYVNIFIRGGSTEVTRNAQRSIYCTIRTKGKCS